MPRTTGPLLPGGGRNLTQRFTGGSNIELSGVLYFPSQTLDFSGGSNLNGSRVMIVADTVQFTGSTVVDLDDVTTSNACSPRRRWWRNPSGVPAARGPLPQPLLQPLPQVVTGKLDGTDRPCRSRRGRIPSLKRDRFKSNRFKT